VFDRNALPAPINASPGLPPYPHGPCGVPMPPRRQTASSLSARVALPPGARNAEADIGRAICGGSEPAGGSAGRGVQPGAG
jgi:hypothetical protein